MSIKSPREVKAKERQNAYLSRAEKVLGNKTGLAELLDIHRSHVNYLYDPKNRMKPEHALKLNRMFPWAKAEHILPEIFTPIMMKAQRAVWFK